MTMKVTRRSQIPGSRFNPTNLELVNILGRRIDSDKRSSFVTELQNLLYEQDPWLIQHVRHVKFKENEWFYFVTRKPLPGIKKADSKRPSRKVAGSGRWKTTGALTHIKDKDGVKVGSIQSINYKANSETEEDGTPTGWLMHEFLLDKPGFQEVALCRIRFDPDEENAQYAPRLEPMMIGLGREDGSSLVENNLQNHMISIHHAAADEEIQYLDAPVETHQDQRMEQLIGFCSCEVVSYSAAQHQQIMGQDSNYPIFNGGMEQHQNFGSNGQIHGHVSPTNGGMEQHKDFGSNGQILGYLSPMEHLGQGFEDMAGYQNQYLLGLETTDSGPSSANQCLGQDLVPMTECLMVHHQEQHLAAQHQHFSMNGSMEQHQDFGSCGQFWGESIGHQQNQILGRQATYMEQQQCQNQFWGQESTDPSHSAQAMEEQQQWNGYSCPYSAQPYDQDMMEHQEFGSSALCLAHNHQYLGQNNDLLALGELGVQHQHLGQDSNLSLTQQKNQILGQPTHLSPMEQQFYQTDYQNQFCGQDTDPSQVPIMMNQALEEKHYVPCSAQPYDHYLGQNNEFPTVPMKTQQQENVVGNSAAQLQLEEQDNVSLMNETMEEQATDLPMNHQGIVGSPTHNGLTQQSLG